MVVFTLQDPFHGKLEGMGGAPIEPSHCFCSFEGRVRTRHFNQIIYLSYKTQKKSQPLNTTFTSIFN